MTARTMREVDAAFYAEVIDQFDQMRGDLKTTSDVLVEFAGEHVWQQAQNAVDYIASLKRDLALSQYSERAALRVAYDNALQVKALKLKYEGGIYAEQEARQASGPSGAEQKRTAR